MLSQPILSTERLLLRPFSLKDASELQQLANFREIADTTISIPYPYRLNDAEQKIASYSQNFLQGIGVHFAITHSKTHQLIGEIELRDIDKEHLSAELSFWLGTEFWGMGIATEAAHSILEYGFIQLQLNRIYAYHMLRNLASGKVMQKLGMMQEGVLRQCVKKWGIFEDVVLYGILRQDWVML